MAIEPEEPVAPRGPSLHASSGAGVRALALTGGVAVAVFVAVYLALATVRSDPEPAPPQGAATAPRTYDEATRAAFLGTCTSAGGESSRSMCECVYERIVAQMPFERFVSLDASVVRTEATRPVGTPPGSATDSTVGSVAPASTAAPGSTAGSLAPATTAVPALPSELHDLFAACLLAATATPGPATSEAPTAPPSSTA